MGSEGFFSRSLFDDGHQLPLKRAMVSFRSFAQFFGDLIRNVFMERFTGMLLTPPHLIWL